MPELPDVEYLRRYAEATSLHRTIVGTSLESDRLLDETTPQLLARRLKGSEFSSARRHGKHLFLELEESGSRARGVLMLHFGMTGTLVYSTDGEDPEYTQLSIRFDNDARLACINKRMLGAIAIVDDVESYIDEQALGPDALAVSEDELDRVIHNGRGAVKSTLMNQGHLAGLGNIYTDEVLFQAGIDPRRPCSQVSREETGAIRKEIDRVCRTAVEAQADPAEMPESFLIRRRESGADCPRCSGTVEKVTISGRSAYLCARCQK